MPVVPLATLKNYFQNGKVPTESEYVDLIDTLENSSGPIDADTLDTYHAGNLSNQIPISNGITNDNLSAHMLNGKYSGNESGQIPVSNGTVNTNLNSDKLDGLDTDNTGLASSHVPVTVSDGSLTINNTGLKLRSGYSDSDPTIVFDGGSSPWRRTKITQPGSTSGWRGRFDIDLGYNGATPISALRLYAQTTGTTAKMDMTGTIEASQGFGSYGTSNPTAAITGQIFYRSDLKMWVQWNGTYWLTVEEFTACFESRNAYTVTTWEPGLSARSDYRPFLTYVTGGYNVATTNNSTNYWEFLIRAIDLQFSSGDWIYYVDTHTPSVLTPSTWYQSTSTLNRVSTVNPFNHFDMVATKHGSPGGGYFSWNVHYRLIIT